MVPSRKDAKHVLSDVEGVAKVTVKKVEALNPKQFQMIKKYKVPNKLGSDFDIQFRILILGVLARSIFQLWDLSASAVHTPIPSSPRTGNSVGATTHTKARRPSLIDMPKKSEILFDTLKHRTERTST